MPTNPQPLPETPLVPPAVQKRADAHAELLKREANARRAVAVARAALPAAEAADRRAQLAAVEAGGSTADVGWPELRAARDELATADRDHDAVIALCHRAREEWAHAIYDQLDDVKSRADDELNARAETYRQCVESLLAARQDYMRATLWRANLERFGKGKPIDPDDLRMPTGRIDGSVRYIGATPSGSEFDARFLEAMLNADASRHIREERRVTADDLRLRESLDAAVNGGRRAGTVTTF